jgi:transcriptional regulator with XRE-family HTH domain
MPGGLKISSAGAVIRELRKKSNLSLSGLAKLTGLDIAQLSRYENNLVALSFPTIGRIAKALGKKEETVVLLCVLKGYCFSLAKSKSRVGYSVRALINHLEKSLG